MTFFRKSLSDYLRFAKIILIVTIVVGFVRLALSLAGANSIAILFSLNAVLLFAAVYFPIRVHTTGFGNYPQLLAMLTILILVEQLIIAFGISVAAVSGIDNIFSSPEMSVADSYWIHAGLHLAGVPVVAAILWIPAAFIMFVTKRIVKKPASD